MSAVEALHRQHVERLQRFARAARQPKLKPRPQKYEIPNVPYGEKKIDPSVPPPIPETWVERQVALYQGRPKEPWFQIVDGPKEFEPRPLRIEVIQRAVCKHFNVAMTELLSQRRTKDIVIPRHIGMYLCKQFTQRSLPEIGRRFGDRDHTTVLSAIRKMGAVLTQQKDMHIVASIEFLTWQLGGERY